VPACAGVVSLPVVKISDSDDVFVAAAESTAVVPDLAVFRRESAEDQKRDSGLFTALLRRRSRAVKRPLSRFWSSADSRRNTAKSGTTAVDSAAATNTSSLSLIFTTGRDTTPAQAGTCE